MKFNPGGFAEVLGRLPHVQSGSLGLSLVSSPGAKYIHAQGMVKQQSKSAFPPCPVFSSHCLLTKELLSLPGFESRTFCEFPANVINGSL